MVRLAIASEPLSPRNTMCWPEISSLVVCSTFGGLSAQANYFNLAKNLSFERL